MTERDQASASAHTNPYWDDTFKTWILTGFQPIRQLLRDANCVSDPRSVGLARDPRDIATRKNRAPALMQLDDPQHRRLRNLVSQAFSLNRINAFRPTIEEIVAQSVHALEDRPRFDAVADYAEPIASETIAALLGMAREDHHQFRRWMRAFVLQLGGALDEPAWKIVETAESELRAYVLAALDERRRHPKADLLSHLIEARGSNAKDGDDRLQEEEILSLIQLLINAGTGTTADLIGNGLFALMRNADQCEQLRANPDHITGAIEETLRYDGPSQFVPRYAGRDMTVNGVEVSRGDLITAALGAANHDPSANPNPRSFDIARPNTRHVAFGAGIHHCLGASLARTVAAVAINALLAAFPKLSLTDEKVQRRPIALFSGCVALPLKTE